MTDIKFSDAPAAASLGDADVLPLASGGVSKGITGANLKAQLVPRSLYDANSVLAASSDDTPAAVTMAASTILARLAAGNIKAASVAEIVALLQAYVVGGTDVPVTDGGTGASTAAEALSNLGVDDLNNGVYGDGSDGSVTFDGSTTILGMAPAGNVYQLTRDFFFENVTINSGVTLRNDRGYRIFVRGTLTGVDATSLIHWNGTNGGGGTNNSSGGAQSAYANSSINSATAANQCPGTNGGAGGTAAGTAGQTQSAAGYGGAGGAGGTGTGGAGGSGASAGAAPNVLHIPPRTLFLAVLFLAINNGGFVKLAGAAGGGGGGGDTTNPGGGGGAGGGLVGVYARKFAGTGSIRARGGNGATPTGGNCGGGGGGGGGTVIVVSSSVSAGAIAGWTIDANGGTKGSPSGSGTDNAANGSSGTVFMIKN